MLSVQDPASSSSGLVCPEPEWQERTVILPLSFGGFVNKAFLLGDL